MFLAGGRGHFGGTENILQSNYLNMWLLLSNALLCPKRGVDCLGQNPKFGRKKACCSTSEWYEFQFRSQSSWYISICTIFLVYRYLCIQNMISKITLACMHCWRPWWSAAWPRPPTKSRYLLSGALHLTTSSIYQRESPMSFFARHQNPFLPELLAAHLSLSSGECIACKWGLFFQIYLCKLSPSLLHTPTICHFWHNAKTL